MRSECDFSKAKRDPVAWLPTGKTRITIRLDGDVLGWFRKQVHKGGGGSYQSLINSALRQHIARAEEPLFRRDTPSRASGRTTPCGLICAL
jgi:uncharacterized protein (DUF4415 family)